MGPATLSAHGYLRGIRWSRAGTPGYRPMPPATSVASCATTARTSFPTATPISSANPQPLYTVAFAAADLWGASERTGDEVCLDLWESYLEPAP